MAQEHLKREDVTAVAQELDGKGVAEPMRVGVGYSCSIPQSGHHLSQPGSLKWPVIVGGE